MSGGLFDPSPAVLNAEHRGETVDQVLDRNVNELLQELRVAFTGVQLLFGFLLSLAFTQRFEDIDAFQTTVYTVTLMSTAVATMLLIAPVSLHRIVFRRRQKAALVVVADKLLVLGLAILVPVDQRRRPADPGRRHRPLGGDPRELRPRPWSGCSPGTRSRWRSGAPAAASCRRTGTATTTRRPAGRSPGSTPDGGGTAWSSSGMSTWLLGAVLLLVMLGATAAGLLLGRGLAHRSEQLREPLGVLQGALIGFMGLVLAFGLSLAVERYEARRADVVAEANAIGTTYLRAQTLAEPVRTESLELLRAYTDVSTALSDTVPGSDAYERTLAESGSYQRRLWELAGRALDDSPVDSAPRLYVETLNDMFDAQSDRVYGLANRVPTAVLVLQVLGAAAAVAALALHLATFGRGVVTVLAVSLLVSVLLIVMFDLDRPHRGFIQVPSTPLEDLSVEMAAPPRRDGARTPLRRAPTVRRVPCGSSPARARATQIRTGGSIGSPARSATGTHAASEVSRWSPCGVPLTARARRTTTNCWRTSPPVDRTTWPGSVNRPANPVTSTCTPASSATSRTAASSALSPTSTRPPGISQAPLSRRRTRSRVRSGRRTATNTDGTTMLAAGAAGSWKYTCRARSARPTVVVMAMPVGSGADAAHGRPVPGGGHPPQRVIRRPPGRRRIRPPEGMPPAPADADRPRHGSPARSPRPAGPRDGPAAELAPGPGPAGGRGLPRPGVPRDRAGAGGGAGRRLRQRRDALVRAAHADPARLHPPPAGRDGPGRLLARGAAAVEGRRASGTPGGSAR